MPDYQKSKIYKLVGYGKTYYGSTTQPLCERKSQHKQNFLKNKNGTCSKELFKLGSDIDIVLVETYPCNNKEELHQRERYYIENNECINNRIPLRTRKEHYIDNKDKILENQKEYNETNKDKIKEQKSEKIKCECGKIYTQSNKSRHKQSKKHIQFINK